MKLEVTFSLLPLGCKMVYHDSVRFSVALVILSGTLANFGKLIKKLSGIKSNDLK